MTDAIAWALKEWAVAVDALLSGDLILLIRKGGIREHGHSFEVPSDRALLFPTFEHQKAEALRAPYQAKLTPQSVPAIGDNLILPGWAQITHQLPLSVPPGVEQLHPFHIWTDAWLAERLAWKPERPTYVLLLRAHRFSAPVVVPYQKQYAGCRSWITIEVPESLPESAPVLPAETYDAIAEQIQGAIAAVKT